MRPTSCGTARRSPGPPREVLPRLGRRVAARMALEQLHAKPRLERVDVADDRRMVHAKHFRRPADRAQPGDLIGRPDLVPVVHRLLSAQSQFLCSGPIACAEARPYRHQNTFRLEQSFRKARHDRHILRIDASARQDIPFPATYRSGVKRLAPGDVVTRDLADPLPLIDATWIGANLTPDDERTDEQRTLALSDRLIAASEARRYARHRPPSTTSACLPGSSLDRLMAARRHVPLHRSRPGRAAEGQARDPRDGLGRHGMGRITISRPIMPPYPRLHRHHGRGDRCRRPAVVDAEASPRRRTRRSGAGRLIARARPRSDAPDSGRLLRGRLFRSDRGRRFLHPHAS